MALFGGLSLTNRKLVVTFLIAVAVKLLLDTFFATKAGLLLRAVGDNAFLVTSLAKDKGNVTLAGLVISNALVALGGALVCHEGNRPELYRTIHRLSRLCMDRLRQRLLGISHRHQQRNFIRICMENLSL